VKFKIGHERFNPAGTRPEYLNKSEAPDDVAADLFAREVRSVIQRAHPDAMHVKGWIEDGFGRAASIQGAGPQLRPLGPQPRISRPHCLNSRHWTRNQ
jgi:hypothetical protein